MLGCFLQVIEVIEGEGPSPAIAHIVGHGVVDGGITTWCEVDERFELMPEDVEQARIMPIPVEVPLGIVVFHEQTIVGALLSDGRTLPLCLECRKAAKL